MFSAANPISIFDKLKNYPGGRKLFSGIVCMKVPYFFSIKPLVLELSHGRCVVLVKNRRKVQNHLGTIHAIAMCNGCEMAMAMVVQSSLPSQLRWIPKSMKVNYLKKTVSDLKFVCEFAKIDSVVPGDVSVLVECFDLTQNIVMNAEITLHVTEKSGDLPRK